MSASNIPTHATRVMPPDFRLAAAAHRCGYAQPGNRAELSEAIRSALQATAPTLIEVRESDFLTSPSGGWYQ